MADTFNDIALVVRSICVEDRALTVWPVVLEGALKRVI